MIGLIKNSKIPIICMCNDRNHQKIRSLANYCFDLRFQRPRVEQIKVLAHTSDNYTYMCVIQHQNPVYIAFSIDGAFPDVQTLIRALHDELVCFLMHWGPRA